MLVAPKSDGNACITKNPSVKFTILDLGKSFRNSCRLHGKIILYYFKKVALVLGDIRASDKIYKQLFKVNIYELEGLSLTAKECRFS